MFTVTATTPGGLPIEIRCAPDGIEAAPRYLEAWLIERAERDGVIAATPIGPIFQPAFEGGTAATLYLAIDVLNDLAAPGTIEVWGEVPAWWDSDMDDDPDDLWNDTTGDDSPTPTQPEPGQGRQVRWLRLVDPNDDLG